MTTRKKPVTFYATDAVLEWYSSLAPGEGTRQINTILERAIASKPTTKADLEVRVNRLEKQMQKLTNKPR